MYRSPARLFGSERKGERFGLPWAFQPRIPSAWRFHSEERTLFGSPDHTTGVKQFKLQFRSARGEIHIIYFAEPACNSLQPPRVYVSPIGNNSPTSYASTTWNREKIFIDRASNFVNRFLSSSAVVSTEFPESKKTPQRLFFVGSDECRSGRAADSLIRPARK